MDDSLALIERVLIDVPELRETYAQHLAEYGDPLPHVFMADVVRFVLEKVENHEAQAALVRLLERLDEEIRIGSQAIQDLVGTSFAENLIGETEALRELWPLMKPALRKEVENFCGTAWREDEG